MNYRALTPLVCVFLLASGCGDDDPVSPAGGTPALDLVIGDIEGNNSLMGCTAKTLVTANSIHVGDRDFLSLSTLTFADLLDTTGKMTGVSFVFDSGGVNTFVDCAPVGGSNDLETDLITANGPVLIRPWHFEGLKPGGLYQMTFTGGGNGTLRRSMRVFVDVDGNGTLEPGEVEDLIGIGGIVETRTFGQSIRADMSGVIIGEYWGGSTNNAGENGAWRGWSIKSAP